MQIPLYAAPDESAELVENPFRVDMTYPVALIPQGALVRYTLAGDAWGQLVFDERDETFAGDVFIRLSDVYTVSDDMFTPITLTDGETPPDKFIFIHKPSSTLAFFENDQLILRTPALMNLRRTGEGQRTVRSRAASEARYGFPFVSLVTVYGENGQAFYSAPWEWWTETVVTDFNRMRYTDGNIRLPDWVVDVPGYGETRLDVFAFRWMGGLADPASTVNERAGRPIVRLYSVRESMNELYVLSLPNGVRDQRMGWDEIIATFEEAALTVPESFYGTTTYSKPE